MKVLITFFLLFTSNVILAETSTCELKTNLESEYQTFNIQLTDAGHGPIENFETEAFKGIITSSKGFIVAGITIKATNQSMSFHGKNTLGGQLIDNDDWIQINCK